MRLTAILLFLFVSWAPTSLAGFGQKQLSWKDVDTKPPDISYTYIRKPDAWKTFVEGETRPDIVAVRVPEKWYLIAWDRKRIFDRKRSNVELQPEDMELMERLGYSQVIVGEGEWLQLFLREETIIGWELEVEPCFPGLGSNKMKIKKKEENEIESLSEPPREIYISWHWKIETLKPSVRHLRQNYVTKHGGHFPLRKGLWFINFGRTNEPFDWVDGMGIFNAMRIPTF